VEQSGPDPRDAADRALSREWFYEFELPDGRRTRTYIPAEVATIHATRLAMIDRVLDHVVGEEWAETTAFDVACHEGFFALHLARRGCRDVLGIDVRRENVDGARLMRDVYQADNVRFEQRDLMSLSPAEYGAFDVVLMLGLLYHLDNPITALRLARSHTRRICMVETQIAPNLSGVIDWGSYRYSQQIVGAFAVVDESAEVVAGNREASTRAISLVPSLEALIAVMRSVGFSRVEVVTPPAEGNEQLLSGKRVLVLGHVD